MPSPPEAADSALDGGDVPIASHRAVYAACGHAWAAVSVGFIPTTAGQRLASLLVPLGLLAVCAGMGAGAAVGAAASVVSAVQMASEPERWAGWGSGDISLLPVLAGIPIGAVIAVTAAAGSILRLSEDGKAVVGSSGKRFAFDSMVGLGGGFGNVPAPSGCDASLWGGVFYVQQPL